MGIEDIRDALVIRHGSSFLLSDPHGNVPRGNAQGLGIYRGDTRHLSIYDFTLSGQQPVVLLSTAELGYAMEQVLTNPTMESGGRTIARGSTEIRRLRVVADVVEETLRVTNYNAFPVTLDLAFEFGADFADIFDVRGYERERHGTLRPPEVGTATVAYSYRGIDGVDRHTTLTFDPAPDELTSAGARFRISLKRSGAATLNLRIDVGDGVTGMPPPDRLERVARDHRDWLNECTQVFSDNEFFNRVMARSLSDIRMLSSETSDGQRYLAAGTPWFDALFGRDSCIASMQLLAYRPEIARDTLRLLARSQGQAVERSRDEEPGKILHELRTDELSRAGELPYGPYFGSIDSTPLFLMLIAEYYVWTADGALVRELLPAMRAAADWLDTYGDITGSGYLSYEKRSEKGLVNQGWKDSWDAVAHAGGALARPPVALVEVQGYAFAARQRLASVLEQVGEAELAARFRRDAARIASQFDNDFWCEDLRFFAIALDGDRQPVRSIASNPAHCLWTGLIDPARAGDVVARLMSNEMFSGWGIRTLAAGSPRYNPIGYHLGTVWPHDNSIAAIGLKIYGYLDELNEVATALFDAAAAFPYFRLPELFGGQARSAQNTPVPFPVACRPQAWAAGAFPLITQAILGLKAEAPERRLRVVAPALPNWLNWVQLRGLRVGDGTVSLLYRREGERTHVEVQEATAGLEVVTSEDWPLSTSNV